MLAKSCFVAAALVTTILPVSALVATPIHAATYQPRQEMIQYAQQSCSGYPTVKEHTNCVARAVCAELWIEKGSTRAGHQEWTQCMRQYGFEGRVNSYMLPPKPGSDDAICTVGVSDDNDEPCYEALAKCSKQYAKGSKGYIKCREEARRRRLNGQ